MKPQTHIITLPPSETIKLPPSSDDPFANFSKPPVEFQVFVHDGNKLHKVGKPIKYKNMIRATLGLLWLLLRATYDTLFLGKSAEEQMEEP